MEQSSSPLSLCALPLPVALCEVVSTVSGSDADFRILEVNEAFGHLVRLSPAGLAGKFIHEAVPGDLQPDAECHRICCSVAEHGGAKTFPQFYDNRRYQVTASHVAPSRFILIYTDITALQSTIPSTLQQEMNLLAIDSNKVAWWEYDYNTHTLSFSSGKATMHGYAVDEFPINMEQISALVHPDDLKEVADKLQSHISRRSEQYEVTYRMKTKAGDYLYCFDFGKVIEWNEDGTPKRLTGIVMNMHQQKTVEEKLQNLTRFKDLLVQISSSFINVPIEMVDQTIDGALQMIGTSMKADRAYIFEYDWQNRTATNTHEWCEQGVSAEKDNLQNVAFELYPDFIEKHEKGEIVYIPDSSLLPEGPTKDGLLAQSIQGLLTVPMMKEGVCIGMIGFDYVKQQFVYSEDLLDLLRIFAELLVNFHFREAVFNELIHAREIAEENQRKLELSQKIAKLGGWEYSAASGLFTFTDSFYALFHTNAEQIGGYTMTPRQYTETFLFPEDRQLVIDEHTKALEDYFHSYPVTLEHKFRYYDGGTGYISVTYFVIRDQYGRVVGTYGVNQDITARKEIELQLRAIKKA